MLIDAADGQLLPGIPRQGEAVPHCDAQELRELLVDEDGAVRRGLQGLPGAVIPDLHEVPESLRVRHLQVGHGAVLFGLRRHGGQVAGLRGKDPLIGGKLGRHFLPLLCQAVGVEGQLGRVAVDIPVLPVHGAEEGGPEAKARDDEGCAPGDAGHGHPEALLVAEEIPGRDLMVEVQPPPEGADVLQEHPLAGGGGPGPHEAGGHLPQGLDAGGRRARPRTEHRRRHAEEGDVRILAELDVRHRIHDLVGGEDHLGEERVADGKAQK